MVEGKEVSLVLSIDEKAMLKLFADFIEEMADEGRTLKPDDLRCVAEKLREKARALDS